MHGLFELGILGIIIFAIILVMVVAVIIGLVLIIMKEFKSDVTWYKKIDEKNKEEE